MVLDVSGVILAVIIATLAAIVYSMRIMVLMERRIARVELHIEAMANKIVAEEVQIKRVLKKRKK